jgi:hypothetical protein
VGVSCADIYLILLTGGNWQAVEAGSGPERQDRFHYPRQFFSPPQYTLPEAAIASIQSVALLLRCKLSELHCSVERYHEVILCRRKAGERFPAHFDTLQGPATQGIFTDTGLTKSLVDVGGCQDEESQGEIHGLNWLVLFGVLYGRHVPVGNRLQRIRLLGRVL